MPKIVILGSCRFEPYEITFIPKKVSEELYNTEKGYKQASDKCYPAIDDCDFVLLYTPDGIGEHTRRDVEYAKKKGKRIIHIDSEHDLMELLP